MEVGFWIVIIFTILYEPIVGYFDFKKFKVKVRQNQEARLKYYKSIIVSLWLPSIFILSLVMFTPLTLQNIGLSFPTINANILGPWATYSAFAVGIIYILVLLFYLFGYHFSEKFRTTFNDAKQKETTNISYSDILPISPKEKKMWTYVSISAGMSEEIIYRGFLIFAIAYLFPDVSIWLVIVIASLLFGLAHTYQGFISGVVRTTIFGLIFSICYIGLGSILPLIAAHFLVDYVAKLGEAKDSEDI